MSTGLPIFDKTIEKTNHLLAQIEEELGWQGHRHQTYSALRIVMHALRDRLPVDVAVNFSAQLPLLLKGVFFDGWKSEIVPVRMDKQEFIELVACQLPLDIEGGHERLIKVVIGKILDAVDPEEVLDLMKVLPADIAEFI